jgi:ribonuclease P protein component
MTLPKQYKLLLRKDQSFFERAHRFFSDYFTYFFIPSDNNFKSVVIIPKKAVSLATDRNKIKRMVYHAIEMARPQVTQNFKVVLIAKKKVHYAQLSTLKTEINQAFQTIQHKL